MSRPDSPGPGGWPVALLVVSLGLAVRLAVAPSYGYLGIDGDLIEHKQAVHRALTRGFHDVYSSNPLHNPALTGRPWEGGFFFNNLPVVHYLRCSAVALYRCWRPRAFGLWDSDLNFFVLEKTDLAERLAASRGFTVALKLPGILFDAWITLVLFRRLSRAFGVRHGAGAAVAYALNPGVIVNTAFWGQHDAVWIALAILSLASLEADHVEAAWLWFALAGLTKPQALGLAPLVLWLSFVRFPWRRLLAAGAAATAAFVVVFLPFIANGNLGPSLTAIFRSTVGGEPRVSCNALNLWWLLTGGRGYEVSDGLPWLGPFSPRFLGLAAFLLGALLLLWRATRRSVALGPGLFLLAAALYLGFFTTVTELHENHMIAVLPLLALGAGRDRRLWAAFGVLSSVLLINLVLFDPALLERVPSGASIAHPLSLAAALAVVCVYAGLGARLARRPSSDSAMLPGE